MEIVCFLQLLTTFSSHSYFPTSHIHIEIFYLKLHPWTHGCPIQGPLELLSFSDAFISIFSVVLSSLLLHLNLLCPDT